MKAWRLLTPLLVIATFVGCVVYTTGAVGQRDPLWFWPQTLPAPVEVRVSRAGQLWRLRPGEPAYQEVTTALAEQLDRIQGVTRLGLTPETLTRYRERETTIEVLYAQPLRLRGALDLGRPTRLLIPLSGPYSDLNVVFPGDGDALWAGALRVESTAVFRAIVARLP